ncbi:MAG: hypothetical protein R2698_14410 [Microthrixaceae bacterium]
MVEEHVAYVTPEGDVMIANGDGSEPRKVGHSVTNGQQLSPLAWDHNGTSIAFVDGENRLTRAFVDPAYPPVILATDAVVPDYVDPDILSWDVSGQFLVYLAATGSGTESVARIVDVANADRPDHIRTIGDPAKREVVEQFFGPTDPIIYQRTTDPVTKLEYTAALVNPVDGSVVGTSFAFDDVTFSPDGRYLFAVQRGTGRLQQLVRVDLRRPTKIDPVTDRGRICRPSVSPNAKHIVFATGRNCGEIWRLDADGSGARRLYTAPGDGTFSVGSFSWSGDGSTLTHAACAVQKEGPVQCEGPYLDIDFATGAMTPRAAAGSVARPTESLTRPLKVSVKITGPVSYSGSMQVDPVPGAGLVSLTATENGSARLRRDGQLSSLRTRLLPSSGASSIGGSFQVVDDGVNETFQIVGRVQPFSLGYAKFRGVWLQTTSMPFTSGNIVITVER